ncbi:helix-turn-helix transcriptional regulator [Escherichia coli]|uniref:helix-turn-helix transcriptional regulator n=1 Tax=Escherichia coli TaxID=562 RepID=UPI000BB5FC21|nr:helix-turn-helix transcriptional regulator [Escherichia coli]EEW3971005.1 helix-turn-helix transcriptional regulator [Escherichia coli]EFU4621073.1 helix-turn-helix transcriptional regulator [Escherichia coli]EHZ2947234.1 helix-turn-helix transcriptional regulator [Escherichia coli]EKQ3773291.1 helix-turn-helix transcriptional regulator [Escherichia coli]ELD8619396.1 helix-turn-helix transcriptional regulator [Escherichia coli]
MGFKHTEEKEIIKINNIRIHKYTLLYTSNCIMDIYSDENKITCFSNKLIFLERGINISVRMQKYNLSNKPYIAFRLSENILRHLKSTLMIIYGISNIDANGYRDISKKIVIRDVDKALLDLLENARNHNEPSFISTLIYLVSRIEHNENIIESLYISSMSFFSDKVRDIIEKDLSRKWTLAIIADVFNVSEITIRKRLESECANFNQILMQSRMSKAALLLLENSYQISQISNMIGISSVSYFIRIFNKHFGVTPKQFFNYFKSG